MTPVANPALPPWVRCRAFLLADIPPGSRVLDVGCGDGNLVAELGRMGYDASGIEVQEGLVEAGRRAGLRVELGRAEALPVAGASVDAIVCSVVLPYTDERAAVAEWGRVLRPGGVVNATYHGMGYGFNYLLYGDSFGRRFYGLRMMGNTHFYLLTGRRLSGLFGDTICQTGRALRRYYAAAGLDLEREEVVERCLGLPRFLCHRLRKREEPSGGPGTRNAVG